MLCFYSNDIIPPYRTVNRAILRCEAVKTIRGAKTSRDVSLRKAKKNNPRCVNRLVPIYQLALSMLIRD